MVDWELFYNRLRTPDFLPGYEIENRLGGGAFGDVYKARKSSIGKVYAINDEGVMYVLKASKEFEVLHEGDFDSSIQGTPSIAGKDVFVRTQSELFCFSGS